MMIIFKQYLNRQRIRFWNFLRTYFKKDIPYGINAPWLFPIAPDPIRLKSFNINLKKMSEKTKSVYFSGIVDKKITFYNL